MHTFQAGDFARIVKEGDAEYVKVDAAEGQQIAATSQTTWLSAKYTPDQLEYIPPYIIPADTLKSFLRFEVPYSAIYGTAVPFDNVRAAEIVPITLADLKAAIEAYLASGLAPARFANEWFWPLWDSLYLDIQLDEARHDPEAAPTTPFRIFSEKKAFAGAWADLDAMAKGAPVDLSRTLADINLFYENQGKPLEEQRFPVWARRSFIRYWLQPGLLQQTTPFMQNLFSTFLDELHAAGDPFALQVVEHLQKQEEESAKETEASHE